MLCARGSSGIRKGRGNHDGLTSGPHTTRGRYGYSNLVTYAAEHGGTSLICIGFSPVPARTLVGDGGSKALAGRHKFELENIEVFAVK